MIPELGQFTLILAMLMAAMLGTLPLIGAQIGRPRWMALARPAAYVQFGLLAVAFALLVHAFVVQDFSVAYVAQNSNNVLPMRYRFSAPWAAHEGSLLLWVLILSVWTALVARFSRSLPEAFVARVLAVLGLVSFGFLLFTVATSNPFLRHLPALADGADLNPLLQDFGLIVHPPMLYMGYVGFAVAFAFAVAALIEGRVDARWVRWSRPWTLVAWAFLTLGIALGSWWAYYELGWGGWWFWDPVENASFMPWLLGTALIHSQSTTEKRGQLLRWTLLLAILAFSLSLLGTFLVRSGVLTSVHAFASDPTRGVYILTFFGIVTGGALSLYAWRAPKFGIDTGFAPVSRESLLLVNNVCLTAACAMVLLGTLYPLMADAMGWGKVSVGPPYFGLLFPILTAPLFLFVPFGPLARWRQDQAARIAAPLKFALIAALVVGAVVFALAQGLPFKALIGVVLGTWVLAGTVVYVRRYRADPERRARGISRESIGMLLAHAGLGIFVIGVMVVDITSVEKDLRMAPGESTEVRGLRFTLEKIEPVDGPNYRADRGTVVVRDGDRVIATMHPQKNAYRGGQVMTEAAIDPGFTRDLYVALGEPLDGGKAWAVRIYHKPFIRWIWLGALFMMLGGFVAAADRRLRERHSRELTARAPPAVSETTDVGIGVGVNA
ncbi:MAG: heme lyase CcmF/NrfE family subunit [Pseudomonadota bacterium]|nr:heme lyase CcmF/NrfE family subunit [Pseudomonadota bacterium]